METPVQYYRLTEGRILKDCDRYARQVAPGQLVPDMIQSIAGDICRQGTVGTISRTY